MKQRFVAVIFFYLSLFTFLPTYASIIKKPPVKPMETPYAELICTDQDKTRIHEIVTTTAENSKLHLLFKQSYLKGLGSQIDHVHPLKFLSTIITDPHLKSCLGYIWNDHFKKNGFLDGLGPALTRESEKGKLQQYIAPFSAEVGVSPESLRPYFDVHDWENMVFFLIQS
jgi:hypothetical protein